MATVKQVGVAAVEWQDAEDLVDLLQVQKAALQTQLAEIQTRLDAAKLDRDTKKVTLKTLAADLT